LVAEPARASEPQSGPVTLIPVTGEQRTLRVFGSHSFFRLWLAQVVSSLGDWIGFVAVAAIAARIGGSSPAAAVGLVLSARLVAAYVTFPVGSALFSALAKVAERLSHYHALHALRVSQESVALYFDTFTFFVSAVMISTLVLPRRARANGGDRRVDFRQTLRELAAGWRIMGSGTVVRYESIGVGA